MTLKPPFSLHRILAPMLLLALATAALPASAAEQLNVLPQFAPPLSMKLAYGDLDLGTAAGVKALYARIHSAANQVCYPQVTYPGYYHCVTTAMANAVQSVGQPALTALYEKNTGKVLPTRLASLQVR
jgi:UrcA family protein